ncbi:MAG: rSAM/selenodomain-associated transferase 2 [Vicingaceae bacterium]|jgi:rSAM/selenodomain-associated transferase 2
MSKQTRLSVIIPTLNEAQNISELLSFLQKELKGVNHEVIVVDAQSSDQTAQISSKLGALVLTCNEKCRAQQMNEGAAIANGEILYFVHADSTPPNGFLDDIFQALAEGYDIGCFRFKFDSSNWLLKINSFFTKFDRDMFRGGDQTLFVKNLYFKSLGGYDASFRIMEEYDFLRKARQELKFKIIPKDVIVSARKYEENSYFRVNLANLVVFTAYKWGVSQARLLKLYKKLIKHPKPEALE